MDDVIIFDNLSKDVLINYLESKKVYNKEAIILKSNYEKCNYKNLDKLIKEDKLINN